ncbi:hypothetical protein Mal64_04600 [Pseudobythopirellula maris]|uniref:ImpA N-terminal domain-containing protein n=1 Tax=Pseudobythopirellula maris TaxID=2527991 RepID=A0A5C5ZSV8_9BACT|nr:type VI secretion system protein TssA [Pseudobythopirellula maris]TWT90077.1 hypothetical protein Mal64_04600 [Pseudobythopirellula maris]
MSWADCETLLQPLPGDSPEGDASHFAMTLAPDVRELRREEAADEFDDATRPENLKRADWPEVARRCEESLASSAKDLRTACLLVEARTRLDGLAGMRSGLEVLARLVDECWDRVTPPEGDDPVESRGTPLANLLDDPVRGVCFPNLVRTLPLLGAGESALSYAEWVRLRSAAASEDNAQFLQGVRQKNGVATLQTNHTDAEAASYWLDSLCGALEERLGEAAPGMLNLKKSLAEVHGLLAEELKGLGQPPAGASHPTTPADGATQVSADGPAADSGLSEEEDREELYQLLEATARRLRAREPHSPVPYLIERAVRLGRLPFPSLMRQVIRDQAALSELSRDFGIAEQDATETETVR